MRLVRRPQWRYLVAGSMVTAILVFSGHPETAVASGLLAVVCGLTLGHRRPRPPPRASAQRRSPPFSGSGLAAPLVLPFTHAMLHAGRVDELPSDPCRNNRCTGMNRAVGSSDNFRVSCSNRPIPTPTVRHLSTPAPVPVSWPVAGSLYCGIVVFAGVAAALVRMRRRVRPLLAFAIVGSLLSVWFIPLERLLLSIPGVRIVVFNRVLPVVALCLCLIGAVGLSRLFSGRAGRAGLLAVLGAAAISIVRRSIIRGRRLVGDGVCRTPGCTVATGCRVRARPGRGPCGPCAVGPRDAAGGATAISSIRPPPSPPR